MGALVIWDDVVDMPNLQSRSHKKALKKNGDDYGENNDFVMDMDDDGGRDGDGERNNNNLVSNLFDDESKENRQMELEDELGAESIAETEDEMEDFVVDDDGGGYVEPALKKQLYEATRVVPFQPSATPWIGNKSYLAFNTVGTVTTTLVNDSHNSIEIEFFDKMAHRDIRFSDPYKFSMASLSKIGCLFGKNPKREDNEDNGGDSTSVILYRAFKGWAGQSDWTFRLPPGEYIQCLALSEGGAAIFTTERLVRFITIGGIQSWIESVPQNIVSCVAGKKMLFCVHQREGITASTMGSSKHDINSAQIGDPVYDWELRRIDSGRKISCGVCPVSHNSRLCWLGFSDENQPLTCDSSGVLRMLVRYTSFLNASWVPVFDAKAVATERKKLENYWPVGVSGLNFMVVIVKDKNNYPPISKPVVTELELKIPMIQPDSATSKEEQKYLLQAIIADALKSQKTILDSGMSAKYAMFSDINGSLTLEMESRREDTEDADIELDKLLLNSIHVACRNNKVMRALDLVGMLRLAESLLAAEKIAVFHKNAVLAEKIMEVRSKFSALSDEDADENSENEESDEENDQNQTGYARDTARLGTVNFTQDHRSSLSNKNLDLAKKAKSGLSHRDLAEADHHMFSVDTQPTVSGQNQYPGTQTDSDLTTTAHLNSSLVGHTDSDISALPGYSPKAKGSKRSVNAAFNPFAVENSTQSSIISKRDGRSSHSYDSNTKDLTNSVTSSNPFDPPVRSRTDSTLIDSSKPTKKPKTYSKLKTQESELSKEFEARTNLSSNTPSTKTLNLLASFAGPKPKKFSSKTTGDTLNGTTAEDSVDLESVQGTPSTVGDSNGL
ncbi:Minichromosome loss protein 1 [Zancudomyces culisetae]|uniref:Minichromosome loss protein 1 n=1 Tax=Zancudomyces culisetae TaxID=1213189 RepID=A0A1R1PWP1_ZANCU|nr:Minichromosome loss protein 1 [Zancudomyces culisetae]|eukprot:OMH85357.1 Minichromosome loss protein 1 [Zancudomyces culisetae]